MGDTPTDISVLHVDDEPDFADLTATFLERESDRFDVTTATGVEEAESLLAEREFDCIVSDYDMPRLNGVEFLETVREDHPELPFVLFTGKGSEEVASEAISAGVTDYLQKEGGTDQYAILANRIENIVEGHRSRRALSERHRRLETLISNLPGMVYRCRNEPAWPMEYVEGECEDITGHDPAALESREVDLGTDLIHPDDREMVWETVQDALERGEPFQLSYRIVTADGDEKWVWERGRGVADEGEENAALEGFITDITERRAREQSIDELTRTTAAFMEATTADEVADILVGAVKDVLGLPANAVHLYDEGEGVLAPAAWTEECERIVGEPPTFEPGESLAWEVFESGEAQVHGDVSQAGDRLNAETAVRSEIILPLGDHGVALVGSEDPAEFDETEVSLARTLVFHATAALDRIAREGELARQRSLLETQQEAVLDGVLVVDDDGEVVSYNDRFVELWDIPDERIAAGDGDEQAWLEWVKDRLADPGVFDETVEYLADNPTVAARDEVELDDGRVFDAYTTPLEDDDGTHYGRLWTFRDVTERKTHERRLEALQERTQRLMHTASVEDTAAVAVDSARRDLDAPLSGVHLRADDDPDVLEPVAFLDRIRDELDEPPRYDRAEVEEDPTSRVVWESLESGEQVVIDDTREFGDLAAATPARSAIVHPLGDDGVFIVSATEPGAFDDADRALVEILATSLTAALDRVERETRLRERERELEIERDRLSALFEMVPDPITQVEFEDDEPIVVEVNSAFEETFGHDAAAVRGRSLNGYIVPPDREEEAADIDERVHEEGTFTREVRRQTADGIGDFLFRSVPIGGDPASGEFFGIYVDVTEQKEAERRLERQNERLEEFASIVSHDLRNPLNVAQGRLELVREDCDSDHLDPIARAHRRMDELIEDILTLAREGEPATDLEVVALADQVADSWANVETADADLVVESDARLRADPTQLRQLLENLVRNAVEHGGDDVTVTVGDLPGGFYVADDGPGVPEDQRDEVFQSGYSTEAAGTGFGLAIVEQVVEAHGWDVDLVESEAGGARFEITGVTFR